MLINELIREYLEFNKYKYTLSVLLTGMNYQLSLWTDGLFDPAGWGMGVG